MSQKPYKKQKKVRILRKKMGFNFQTKAQKWQKSISFGRFGDP